MIELERHIEILLLSNDCVIVPNFGGFMAHHVEARYDDKDGSFLPPQRTLGFNPQLVLNDSLLAQSYIEAYDISYPEAIRRINDEVRELRQHIENKGFYEFNDLGVISINDDGKYEFEPCEAGILTPELYGLSSFEMAPLQEAAPAVELKTRPAKANRTGTEERPRLTSNIFVPDSDSHSARTIPITTLRNVAVACIAVLAFLLFPSPVGNSGSTLTQSMIDTGMLYRILPKGAVQGTADLKKAIAVKDTLKAASEVPAAITADTQESMPQPFYSVVLCSRVTKRNAQAFADQLHRNGYDEAEVHHSGKYTRVIYGRYETEAEAYRMMQRLHAKEEFKDCWVTKLKGK